MYWQVLLVVGRLSRHSILWPLLQDLIHDASLGRRGLATIDAPPKLEILWMAFRGSRMDCRGVLLVPVYVARRHGSNKLGIACTFMPKLLQCIDFGFARTFSCPLNVETDSINRLVLRAGFSIARWLVPPSLAIFSVVVESNCRGVQFGSPIVLVLCSRCSGLPVLQLLRDWACGPVAESVLRNMVILDPNLSHGSIFHMARSIRTPGIGPL